MRLRQPSREWIRSECGEGLWAHVEQISARSRGTPDPETIVSVTTAPRGRGFGWLLRMYSDPYEWGGGLFHFGFVEQYVWADREPGHTFESSSNMELNAHVEDTANALIHGRSVEWLTLAMALMAEAHHTPLDGEVLLRMLACAERLSEG